MSKDKSVISGEIQRNNIPKGVYKVQYAVGLVNISKERFNHLRKMTPALENKIRNHIINDQWSLEQIKGRSKLKDEKMVSHERIYQLIRSHKHTIHKLKAQKKIYNMENIKS